MTIIVTESVSVFAPPVPVLPKSSVSICKDISPVKLLSGLKLIPLKAALISLTEPVKVMEELLLLPAVKVNPVVPLKVIVPVVLLSLTSVAVKVT